MDVKSLETIIFVDFLSGCVFCWNFVFFGELEHWRSALEIKK